MQMKARYTVRADRALGLSILFGALFWAMLLWRVLS
jgi:hypothetical protein